MKFYIFLLVVYCLAACSQPIQQPCSNPKDLSNWDSCHQVTYVYDEFTIHEVADSALFYRNNRILAENIMTRERIYDEDSIPVLEIGGKVTYMPTNMIQYAYGLLDEHYAPTKDSLILAQVERIANKLLDAALAIDSCILIPYTYTNVLHSGDSEDTLLAPWYSAMAQGQMLSLTVWLYELTQKEEYLRASTKLFNSFKRIKGNGAQPWISCIDKNNHIWYEEYPVDLPAFTLNGKIFAIFGLYDYYRITKKEEAAEWLKAGLTTIKANIHKYRVKGHYSLYCLKHHSCQIYPYHAVHIEQLEMLYQLTKDEAFLNAAQAFRQDTPKRN